MADRPKAKVAYLVVCWNNRTIIKECLDSIKAQSLPDGTIYVIDNASADESAEFIAAEYPEVTLVASNKNNGFSRGNNILIKQCLKDKDVTHMALINSDAVLDREWASQIIQSLQGKKRVASVQGTTLDYYDHQTIDSLHIYIRDDFQSVQYGYTEQFDAEHAYTRRVFGVNAAAALYTREFIESQPRRRLFDERFYMYLEDVDVAFRALMAGWSNFYVPTALAYHMGSVSSKKRSSGYNYYMTYRNQTALLIKNAPMHTLLRFFPNLLRNDVRFYRHYRIHDRNILGKIVRGRIAGLWRAPIYLGSRFRLRRGWRLSSRELERVMQNQGIFY